MRCAGRWISADPLTTWRPDLTSTPGSLAFMASALASLMVSGWLPSTVDSRLRCFQPVGCCPAAGGDRFVELRPQGDMCLC